MSAINTREPDIGLPKRAAQTSMTAQRPDWLLIAPPLTLRRRLSAGGLETERRRQLQAQFTALATLCGSFGAAMRESMRSRSFLKAESSEPLRLLPVGRRTRMASTFTPLTDNS